MNPPPKRQNGSAFWRAKWPETPHPSAQPKTGDIDQFADDYGLTFNLPEQVAFPKTVKDIVDVASRA